MVRIFDEAFPFVIAVVSGEITEDDIAAMAKRYATLHARGQRFYLAQETRQVVLPNAVGRRLLADLNNDFADRIKKNIYGIGLIIPSRLASAALTAVYWLSREASPTRFHSSAADLVKHARETGAIIGVTLSPQAERMASLLDEAFKAGTTLTNLDLGRA